LHQRVDLPVEHELRVRDHLVQGPDRFLPVATLGDVGDAGEDAFAATESHRREHDLDPETVPVGGLVEPFERLRALVEGLADPIARPLGRVGAHVRGYVCKRAAEQFLLGVAEHLAVAVVHVEEGPRLGIVDAETDRGLLPGLVVDRVALMAANVAEDAVRQVDAGIAERGFGGWSRRPRCRRLGWRRPRRPCPSTA